LTVTAEDDEIVVTGVLIKPKPDTSGALSLGRWVNRVAYVPPSAPDPLAEEGGNQLPQTVSFELIDGDLIVKLPGYDFTVKLPAADWARMGAAERAGFIKMMAEFRDSPMLVETLNNLQTEDASQIIIRYDTVIHRADGTTMAYPPGRAGQMSAIYNTNPDGSTNDANIKPGTAVIININANLVPDSNGTYATHPLPNGQLTTITFAWVLAHELRHTFYPGSSLAEENQTQLDAEQMVNQVFQTPGANETSAIDYLSSQTFIGSIHGDTATGTGAGDVLSGLSGNDVLSGAGGDDLVRGGVGADQLNGGSGDDVVIGGAGMDQLSGGTGSTSCRAAWMQTSIFRQRASPPRASSIQVESTGSPSGPTISTRSSSPAGRTR
jgi:hypothetical protein